MKSSVKTNVNWVKVAEIRVIILKIILAYLIFSDKDKEIYCVHDHM